MDKKLLGEIITELIQLKSNSLYEADLAEGFNKINNSISFFMDSNGMIIISNTVGNAAFIKLQSLLVKDTFIFKNYTDKEIKNFIVKLISINEIDEKSILAEIKIFKNVEKEKFVVFLPVYGIEIKKEIQFGNFIFHNADSFKTRIKDICPEQNINLIMKTFENDYFIEGTVKTRSEKSASEIIQYEVTKLLNIIRFFICSKENKANINIMNSSIQLSKSLVAGIEKKTLSLNSEYLVSSNPVTLEVDHFSNNPTLTMFINNTLGNTHKTEIEKRLNLAVQWIGESLNEQNDSMKFLKIFFAFESILQVKADNQTEKMAEFICFLLEDKKEKRLELKKNFKKLYNIRSRISHGEIESVSKFDIYYSYDLIYGLINVIVTNLDKFNTLDDISNYVDEKKYI
ncbi:hypothetical protein JZO80_02870 [Vagococcus fluvialis]|uniref:HEPN domain-containing protein n=1 Tax=Vagococcus fluvialis TaxID=2738 RepID=UPI000A359937|nr:HEPN domain-containing protein [Vagococcus fluvialis]MBO0419091.1 hypothetical protein [Vagococcus fluvialis]OTP29516.1 hypothetical protein A5798_002684 [Enterococcus sp. 6C8_DIV0013]